MITGRTPGRTAATPVRVTRAPSVKTVTPVIGVSALSCPVSTVAAASVMVTASHDPAAGTGIWACGSRARLAWPGATWAQATAIRAASMMLPRATSRLTATLAPLVARCMCDSR